MVQKTRFILILCIILMACLRHLPAAEGYGCFWGRVVGADGSPLSGIRILLTIKNESRFWDCMSDDKGWLRIDGLSQGVFVLGCARQGEVYPAERPLIIGTSENIFTNLRLPDSESGEKKTAVVVFLRNYAYLSSSTSIDEPQMRLLPSANSVWTLIENQDLSATTNRIDVGGLWTTSPALFSARGGTSWTQNAYRLNGMDVTDPFLGGTPLFIPDFWSLKSFSLENAGHSAGFMSPGGLIDLTTEDGGTTFKGKVAMSYGHRLFSSSNITPALKEEHLLENNRLNHSFDGHIDLSGPLVPGKFFFFTSWTGLKISRNMAEFSEDDKSSLLSGLVRLKYESGRSVWRFLWAGQEIRDPTAGAGRNVPYLSTLNRKNFSNLVQASGTFRIKANHVLTAAAGFVRTDSRSRFQDRAGGQHAIEILRNVIGGPAAAAGEDRLEALSFSLHGDLRGLKNGTDSRFLCGAELRKASSTSQRKIKENVHLRFFEDAPLEVVRYLTPLEYRQSSFEASAFAQETLTWPGFLSATMGIHMNYSRGWIPGEKAAVKWLHAAPRIGFVIPLSKSGKTALKLFVGRYYFRLPLSIMTYGNPQALGGVAYAWEDRNGNGLFEEGEAGRLVRREGPFYARIDPSLKRPSTDELSIGFVRQFDSGLSFSLIGYVRRTKNLVETLNTGVPFSSYEARSLSEIGDDRIPNTHDDLFFTLFDQSEETLGQDFFLLTNPGGNERNSRYEGFDLTLIHRTPSHFSFFVSLTATQAVGTASPGNTEWQNDDGVIGTLYDDPNTLINAKGRLRFDRAYTGRIGFALRLPLGIRLGYLLKYYDGQPFARKIVVTGFRQGPFIIMAHPRGVARYEFNMTHDLRLQKAVAVGGGTLRIILDGFNIFNQNLATGENEWTGEDFLLRFATEIQSPRIFRLGFIYEF